MCAASHRHAKWAKRVGEKGEEGQSSRPLRTILPPLPAPRALVALEQGLAPLQAVAAKGLFAPIAGGIVCGGLGSYRACGGLGRIVVIERNGKRNRGAHRGICRRGDGD